MNEIRNRDISENAPEFRWIDSLGNAFLLAILMNAINSNAMQEGRGKTR
jgi:hypothetical protein